MIAASVSGWICILIVPSARSGRKIRHRTRFVAWQPIVHRNPRISPPRARRRRPAGGGNAAAESPISARTGISGTVRRVLYRGNNGYCILKLEDDRIVVGNLLDAREGAILEGEGENVTHPKFGPQIKAHWLAERIPEEPADLLAFLSRGSVPGIGPKLAKLLVDTFGSELPTIFDRQPRRLLEINGIGEKKLLSVRRGWERLRAVRRVTAFLNRIGLGPQMAWRVYTELGENAVAILRTNPYRLTRVRGIGFERADQAAAALGLAPDAPARLAAAIEYAVEDQANRGHTVTSRPELVAQAAKLTEQPVAAVDAQLVRILTEPNPSLRETPEGLAPTSLYSAENQIAQDLSARL
ncbi:MAG: hypothetical protein B7Z66_07290 [Chromatiales bacterium 21-64-14]|nr:MAG: hypothetical protein B7Z66_07290 [Chromatiales bacterium 21-64-14]HQU15460.1 helix-hairpin-helix domain-containing protein [Gammaproteobacteria bacterium]